MTSNTAPQRVRGAVAALVACVALVAGACAPQSPPAGGGFDIEFGPLTIPLPPIEVRAPATVIPVGVCQVSYQPPGVQVRGATLSVPRVRIDPAAAKITVPDVRVRIPQLRVPLSTVTLNCLGIGIPVQTDLIVPSSVHLRAATVDLNARTITLSNPSFTIEGAGIGVLNLVDVVVPLPPIVNVPLPSGAIAF